MAKNSYTFCVLFLKKNVVVFAIERGYVRLDESFFQSVTRSESGACPGLYGFYRHLMEMFSIPPKRFGVHQETWRFPSFSNKDYPTLLEAIQAGDAYACIKHIVFRPMPHYRLSRYGDEAKAITALTPDVVKHLFVNIFHSYLEQDFINEHSGFDCREKKEEDEWVLAPRYTPEGVQIKETY
jgi:hypothetical protein